MTEDEIIKLQKEHGVYEIQERINSGIAWELEGFYGRQAMSMLEDGSCYLPNHPCLDAYGQIVPSREHVEPGTTGSLENAISYWKHYTNKEVNNEPAGNDNTADR